MPSTVSSRRGLTASSSRIGDRDQGVGSAGLAGGGATPSQVRGRAAASTTEAPAAARVRAACWPMPRLAPVTSAVRPSRRSVSSTDMAYSCSRSRPTRAQAPGRRPAASRILRVVAGQERGHPQLQAGGQADAEGRHQPGQPEGVDDQVAGDHGHDRAQWVRSHPARPSTPTRAAATRNLDDVAERWRPGSRRCRPHLGEPGHPRGEPEGQVQDHPARARRHPRAAAPSSTAKVCPVIGTGANGSLTASWAARPVKCANPTTRTASRTRSPGSTSASTRSGGDGRGALRHGHWWLLFPILRRCPVLARTPNSTSPWADKRRRRPPQLGEAALPARLVPVAALGGLSSGHTTTWRVRGRSPAGSRSGTPWSPGTAARSGDASRRRPTPGPAARPGTATAAASCSRPECTHVAQARRRR